MYVISNVMDLAFTRELRLDSLRSSAFIFGPRMTGKTTCLRGLKAVRYFDLLDPETELRFRQTPRLFWEEINSLSRGSQIIIDEVQRIPALLDYVQRGIDQSEYRFLLSGSSARKLRRGGANLLGGRALILKLHPLTIREIGKFEIADALQFGTLPKIHRLVLDGAPDEARRFLKSYVTTYLKEEIQAEALTRNLGAFQRFFAVAGQAHGQVIEYANISRECSVPMSTVKEYYQILEDTLLGEFLWPFDRSERKKARPKFYFFDCGVARALQNRLTDPPTPVERGTLFESWFIRELVRIRDYEEKEHEFSFWRKGTHEVDLLVSGGHGPLLAIECKSGKGEVSPATVAAFRNDFPKVPLVVASLADDQRRKLASGLEILPWRIAIQKYRDL